MAESPGKRHIVDGGRAMSPLQNRVTPWGALEAVGARYAPETAAFGNRGCLHDGQRRITRAWQTSAWLACELRVSRTRTVQRDDNRAFNGRRRVVMRPGFYTELFFLDQLVATAAGHRPCACCRRADYAAFVEAWAEAHPSREPWTARAIDEVLHGERAAAAVPRRPPKPPAGAAPVEPAPPLPLLTESLASLPDGAFVSLDAAARDAWLHWRGRLLRWSHDGYCACIAHDDAAERATASGGIRLITPPSLVETMRRGWVPGRVHASASALIGGSNTADEADALVKALSPGP